MNNNLPLLYRPKRFIQLVSINSNNDIEIIDFHVALNLFNRPQNSDMLVSIKSACPAVIFQKSKMHFRVVPQKFKSICKLSGYPT
ncbi:hypothetical protein D3C76_1482810 [compost metagenome]